MMERKRWWYILRICHNIRLGGQKNLSQTSVTMHGLRTSNRTFDLLNTN